VEKKQVIETIKKEDSEKLPDIKSYEDVLALTELVTRKLKRMGDALGRQSRVIHIFAKKYAAKLKRHLAVLNAERSELQSLVDNFKKLNDDGSEISKKIVNYYESKNNLETNHKQITDMKNSIGEFEKKIENAKNSISELKSGEEYLKYIETQEKLEKTKNKALTIAVSRILFIHYPHLSKFNQYSNLPYPRISRKILLLNMILYS